MRRTLLPVLSACVVATALSAQSLSLHSVTVDADDDVTVVYSKSFNTCAHLRLSNASCTSLGPLVHTQNHFCASGNLVSVTVARAALTAAFGVGISVKMVDGNNPSVQSSCVTVACDGKYGVGCAPAGGAGAPVLDALEPCPLAGGSLDLQVSNGAAQSLGVLGLGLTRVQFPVFGCELLIGSIGGTAIVSIDASGNGGFVLPIPAGIAGFELTAQTFVLDVNGPQGFTATNGLLARIL